VAILALMRAAILAGYAPDARTAMAAAILAPLLTSLFQVLAITPHTAREVRGVASAYRKREWMMVALPIFLIEGFMFLLTNADVLLVGFFLSPKDVAIYFATVKTLALVHFVYFAVK